MPVLTKKDRILISELNTLKGFGAKKLINEFPSKGWKVSTVRNFLDKLKKQEQSNGDQKANDRAPFARRATSMLSMNWCSVRKMRHKHITLLVKSVEQQVSLKPQ